MSQASVLGHPFISPTRSCLCPKLLSSVIFLCSDARFPSSQASVLGHSFMQRRVVSFVASFWPRSSIYAATPMSFVPNFCPRSSIYAASAVSFVPSFCPMSSLYAATHSYLCPKLLSYVISLCSDEQLPLSQASVLRHLFMQRRTVTFVPSFSPSSTLYKATRSCRCPKRLTLFMPFYDSHSCCCPKV